MTETKNIRVLVVDDEPSILELLRTALVALGGYEVETARSGREALAMLGDDRPLFDLVLLDIQMPEMNGVDVCKRMRDTLGYRFVPIIMLTAMSQMEYVDKAFIAGATDYITKPFNFEDLRRRVGNALRTYQEKVTDSDEDADAEDMLAPLTRSPRENRLKFEAKIDFSNIERFLETERFDNYVRQMVGSRAPHTSAFAVKISNGYYLHRALASDDFVACLSNVAVLLSQVTEKTGSLISYRGRGLFLCVEYGNRLSDTDAIERVLNSHMTSSLTVKNTRPKIVVSEHAELKQHDRISAKSLMSDAIAGAETRAEAEVDETEAAGQAVRQRIVASNRVVTESRPYRDMLSSVLRGA